MLFLSPPSQSSLKHLPTGDHTGMALQHSETWPSYKKNHIIYSPRKQNMLKILLTSKKWDDIIIITVTLTTITITISTTKIIIITITTISNIKSQLPQLHHYCEPSPLSQLSPPSLAIPPLLSLSSSLSLPSVASIPLPSHKLLSPPSLQVPPTLGSHAWMTRIFLIKPTLRRQETVCVECTHKEVCVGGCGRGGFSLHKCSKLIMKS